MSNISGGHKKDGSSLTYHVMEAKLHMTLW
jgi:hypothetical protein